MSNSYKPYRIFIFLLCCTNYSYAQLSGNNLAEYQYGQLPSDTSSFSAFYDRMVAHYNYKRVKISATLEQFNTSIPKGNYVNLSQFSVQYKHNSFEFKIGNFYETIGRGSLLRSFEIPGAILEDLSYRSRHYFNRDILGANAKYHYKNFSTKLLYGRPLNYVLPPSQEFKSRRSDNIAAAYADYSFKKQTVGVAAMKHWNVGNENTYFMATASGNIFNSFSYYTEFTKNVSDFAINDFSNQSSYALYNGLNFTNNNFGVSIEYKSYKNVLIGSGINEPPALVKEHSYRVLNRSTHVLQPINEKGYQAELFYTFPNLSKLTFNNTLAINDFGTKFAFNEFFLEYDFSVSDKHDIKLFTDFADDPFKLQKQRLSAGISTDFKAFKKSSVKIDYEFQTFKRLGEYYQNHVLSLGYAFKSSVICNITAEYSDDSFIVNEGSKIWLGANVKYQANKNHSVQIFAGERRGGPACNAGVCYEVLDFKGAEIRLTSRF